VIIVIFKERRFS